MSIRRKLAIALVIIVSTTCFCLWFVCFSAQHWLNRVDFVTVLLDDRPVQADVYMGHPTDNEAEVVALAHVPGVGDYFFDFDDVAFRKASAHEFIRFHRGVWIYRPMRDGSFSAVLPFQNDNEFRIASSNGHILTVQF